MKKEYRIIFLIVLSILLIDQSSKFIVKTSMHLGESIMVFDDWFHIRFTENPGIAFGLQFGGNTGKMLLSLFRLAAVGLIGYYIHILLKRGTKRGFVYCVAAIFAGAFGNIIDSLFYGIAFGHSSAMIGSEPAQFLPESGGYAPILYGKVVDMLYFPLIETTLPDWFPLWGGESFTFFSPIFNVADAAISVGVIAILLFHREVFKEL